MEIPLTNIKNMKECEMRIDENRYLQIEDHGRWLLGDRNEIFRVFISFRGTNFIKFTIHNLQHGFTLTGLEFREQRIEPDNQKFYDILKMYGPKIIQALNN